MMKHNNGIVSHLVVTNISFLEEIKTQTRLYSSESIQGVLDISLEN